MILTYRILTNLIYPLLFILIFIRKIFNKEDPSRFKEKIFISHFNINRKKDKKLIWFHAASIGEFKSIVPIVEELNNNNVNLEFLITTTTLSSSSLAKEEFNKFDNIHHRFFPLDIDFLIRKFLFLWKPDAIFLVDSEIWPNLIIKANKNKIPLALINARITSKTFNRWMMFPNTAKRIFGMFNLCLTSNLETKNYLKKFDVTNIYFNGNIKLINKINKDKIKNLNEKILLKSRFWFAASTHIDEEVFCLKTHLSLKEKYKDVITIIAPRHINRCQKIKNLFEDHNLEVQILDKDGLILENKKIIIINSFGILNNYFKYAKSVFIGKSAIKKMENVGGQNPIDAAKLGCKIYHGPYVYNFKEIYEILEKMNISKKIVSIKDLSDNLIKDLKNSYKENNQISNSINDLGQKTLTDTMKNINKFLFNEIK
jgi:3-deoxy-D-manno-octulosonic-acid transferase|tara:strand:- start:218 stop:1501 length:1284 start_codon:yes stop_codon:yes gene_type:complete